MGLLPPHCWHSLTPCCFHSAFAPSTSAFFLCCRSICVPEQRAQFSEQKSAHADLLVLLASQEIEKNTLMEHLGRHGAEHVQEAMKSAFEQGALDFSKLQR